MVKLMIVYGSEVMVSAESGNRADDGVCSCECCGGVNWFSAGYGRWRSWLC